MKEGKPAITKERERIERKGERKEGRTEKAEKNSKEIDKFKNEKRTFLIKNLILPCSPCLTTCFHPKTCSCIVE